MIAKWWRPVRKLLIACAGLLVVVAVFAAGIGIYFAALASWSLLLVWWPRLLAGTAAVVALGAWWLWWRLPKRQVERLRLTIRDPKARADVEDNFRKTIGQLLGGAAVLIGAGFAYLQFQQQQTAAHDLLISNQVAKGFELLGNKDNQLQQRLGGIYALEGVMNTSKEYHRPVLEALGAFVRDGTRTEEASAGAPAADKSANPAIKPQPLTKDELDALLAKLKAPATDIQAALTVIGRRKEIGGIRLDLNHAHIPKANLSGAKLIDASLLDASLLDADLSGADLSGASLGAAKNLTQQQLDQACGTDVKLPARLTPPKPCP